jgi:acyl-CoA thioester hydrolase
MLEGGVEVWRGGVNAWQCDQMGHLNVRFYAAHAMEGLVGLAGALGMDQAFSPRGASSLAVKAHHIRFLKEARVGDPLEMSAGILGFGEDDARALMLLSHSPGGAPSAVIQTDVAHVSAADGRRFPWSQSARRRAESLLVSTPDGLGPRSLDPGVQLKRRTLAEADSAGLIRYGAGAYGPEDCDVFGRVAVHRLVARMIDGAAHGFEVIREAVGDSQGMAAVEYRIAYFEPPRAGDRYLVRAALVQAEPRRLGFCYWTFDAGTGAPLAAARSVLVPFDLDARKATTLPDKAVASLRKKLIEAWAT